MSFCAKPLANQQREPFVQTSEPAPAVMELTREDGLADKLDALA